MLRNMLPSNQQLLIAALCLLTEPAFADNTARYSGCGTLTLGVECPHFVGDDGTSFSITGTGKFTIGDRVFVSGTICFDCPSICQEGPVFQIAEIGHCIKIPPHKFLFSECGTLVLTPNPGSCLLFESDSGGLYWVKNTNGFAPGDYVRITTDQISTPCFTFCNVDVEACLEDNGIQSCIDAPLFLDTCGWLTKHPIGTAFCTVFEDDQGNAWLLQDQGNFEIGDRVHVTGPAFFCTPLCGNVMGCVDNDPPIGCTGDVNSDGRVDVDDLLAVISHWGPCARCAEDVDADGAVEVDDLLLVIANWHLIPVPF